MTKLNENLLSPEIRQELKVTRDERKRIKDDLTHRWEGMTESQLQYLYEEVQDLNDRIQALVTGKITSLHA